MSRKREISLVATVLCMTGTLLWFAHRADQTSVTSVNTPVTAISSAPLATIDLHGSWVGEMGNILNMRSDGSGRSRLTGPKLRDISYFEWSFDPALRVFMLAEGSNSSLARTFNEALFAKDFVRFTIEDVSSDSFDLVDVESGHKQRFVRTRDVCIESAP